MSWNHNGWTVWLSWINGNSLMGNKKDIEIYWKKSWNTRICQLQDCVQSGREALKMTQSVFMHSLEDKFEMPKGHCLIILTVSELILMKCDPKYKLITEQQTKHCSCKAKLIHMQWKGTDMYDAVPKFSCHMNIASNLNYKVMLTLMNYVVWIKSQVLFLKPIRTWVGNDCNLQLVWFRWCKETRELETNVRYKSIFRRMSNYFYDTQKYICLSVIEAELNTQVTCTQDILYVMQVLKYMGLKVKNAYVV